MGMTVALQRGDVISILLPSDISRSVGTEICSTSPTAASCSDVMKNVTLGTLLLLGVFAASAVYGESPETDKKKINEDTTTHNSQGKPIATKGCVKVTTVQNGQSLRSGAPKTGTGEG